MRPGVLLVEGKSYPAEFHSGGAGAKPGSASRALIARSLGWTQDVLGASGASVPDWCGRLYQSANRLAHLCWLRSRGVDAWLVHLLFVNDPRSPTSAPEWENTVELVERELGLPRGGVAHAPHTLLSARTREELLG
jgi:hypothetical protein